MSVSVCLHSFFGVSKNLLDLHSRKTGESVYFHIKRRVKPKPAEEEQEVSTWGRGGARGMTNFAQEPEEPPPEKKPTRLAIGVEGGFTGGIEKVRTNVNIHTHTHVFLIKCTTVRGWWVWSEAYAYDAIMSSWDYQILYIQK